MSVRKRKDGRWQMDIVVHRKGVRERVREACGREVRNRSQALECERKRRAELEGGAPAGKAMTFGEHAEEVYTVVTKAQRKSSTQKTERCILDVHLLPAFKDLRLDEIDNRRADHLIAEVSKTCKSSTVNQVTAKLSKFLNIAVDWGRLAKVPRIRRLKLPEQRPEFLDFDEAPRLLAAFDPEWYSMALCAHRAGLRRGELLELRWMDLDLVKGTMLVQRAIYRGVIGTPKGGKSREIPLSDELRANLKRRRQLHDPKDLVFGHPSGRNWTSGEILSPLFRACKRAGLRPIGWHVMRHTFASHLVMRGVSIKIVQELMGHAKIEQTMVYAHLTPEIRRDAVALLDSPGGHEPAGSRSGHESGGEGDKSR